MTCVLTWFCGSFDGETSVMYRVAAAGLQHVRYTRNIHVGRGSAIRHTNHASRLTLSGMLRKTMWMSLRQRGSSLKDRRWFDALRCLEQQREQSAYRSCQSGKVGRQQLQAHNMQNDAGIERLLHR